MRETVLILPCYNPDGRFPALVRELKAAGFERIVAVDDGSRPGSRPFFEEAAALGAVVLAHAVNLGKGRALKTAFNYVLNRWGREARAVCADCDGQHAAADILRVVERLDAAPDCIVMGCRSFDGKGVPARSRFGNKLTRWVFRALCGVKVSDTQTGLRGLSGEHMALFLATRGERYEYEMNMLLDAKEAGVPIAEVPIETIYLEENVGSHFNPLRDSLRIYSVFFKFIFSSLVGFAVDYVLFTLLDGFLPELFSRPGFPALSLFGRAIPAATCAIWAATFLARLVSSLLNYSINKRRVFPQEQGRRAAMARYYILSVFQMGASAGLVGLFSRITGGPAPLVKLPVDLILFFLSFQIQREWVFRGKKGKPDA